MPVDAETRSFTVRSPAAVYEAVKEIARRDRKSVNAVVNERLGALVREETDRKLEQWFEELGADANEADAEYAFDAQSEVVLSEHR
jgi:hypothetical protein